MVAVLDDLLRYKKKVVLTDPRTGKDLKAVWVRILGDEDLKEAFRESRLASSARRKELRNKESSAYKDEIEGVLRDSSKAEHIELILAAKENEFANSAPIVVPREDAPKIEEIAVQPDAPTLEEQERLDSAEEEQDTKFKQAVEDYIQTKLNEVRAELNELSDERLFELSSVEYINIQSLQSFLDELNSQKVFRGTYSDDKCRDRGFSSIEAYKNAHPQIKAQLLKAYTDLEIGVDDLKN